MASGPWRQKWRNKDFSKMNDFESILAERLAVLRQEGLYRELLKEGVLVIHGDAKRHDVLQMAGILQARGICIVIDNDSDNLYITVTARSLNPKMKIITRAGQQRYANAIRNSGADEVVIPEYEGGLMTGRLIQKYYPLQTNLE